MVLGIGEDEVALAVGQPQDRHVVDQAGVRVEHEAKLAIARLQAGDVAGQDLLQRCLGPVARHPEQAAIAQVEQDGPAAGCLHLGLWAGPRGQLQAGIGGWCSIEQFIVVGILAARVLCLGDAAGRQRRDLVFDLLI